MSRRITTGLALAFLLLVPTAGWCDLVPYDQDFEALSKTDPVALANDGWLVWATVYAPAPYGYGGPAPNGGEAYSAVVMREGGPDQGAKQLSVYNDYYNTDAHSAGYLLEANVYQEQVIGPDDYGTWEFAFQHKRGNIEGTSTAAAFIKILDYNTYEEITSVWVDMTSISELWGGDLLAIPNVENYAGQRLQFGFVNTATNFEGAGIFYDNLEFGPETESVNLDIMPGICPNRFSRKPGDLLVALPSLTLADILVDTVRLEGVAPTYWEDADVATPFDGDLCGCTPDGGDTVTDVVLTFDPRAIVEAAGVKKPDEYRLTLTGQKSDGTFFEAQDCITTLKEE